MWVIRVTDNTNQIKTGMDNLLKYNRSLTNFSDESWEILQPALTKRSFKKNDFLLKQGQVCNALFYIDKDIAKAITT